MKKNVKFTYEEFEAKIAADALIILPRIGEKIDISGLLDSDADRKKYQEKKAKKGTLFVTDIFHSFYKTEQTIEITLSNELDFYTNDFYSQFTKK